MATKVKWYGDKLLADLRRETPDALYEVALKYVEMAAARAPKRPHGGALAKSGYAAVENKSTYQSNKIHNKERKPPKGGAVAGFAAFYAKFIEFGKPNTTAQPFMRTTLDEAKAQLGGLAVARLKKFYAK